MKEHPLFCLRLQYEIVQLQFTAVRKSLTRRSDHVPPLGSELSEKVSVGWWEGWGGVTATAIMYND